MIYSFLFATTQEITIRKLPPSFLESIKSKHLPPSGFPRKERNFGWNSIHPNVTFWKNDGNGAYQQAVHFLDSKLPVSSFLLKNRVFLQSNPVTPQNKKQIVYHIQFPIIKVPKKP